MGTKNEHGRVHRKPKTLQTELLVSVDKIENSYLELIVC